MCIRDSSGRLQINGGDDLPTLGAQASLPAFSRRERVTRTAGRDACAPGKEKARHHALLSLILNSGAVLLLRLCWRRSRIALFPQSGTFRGSFGLFVG